MIFDLSQIFIIIEKNLYEKEEVQFTYLNKKLM